MSYGPRQKRTPEQWQQWVEAQAASGQTQVAFCADHDLSKSSFQHWKRRLQSNGRAASAAQPALFTPLSAASAPCEPDTGWTIELDLGDGICLRLRRPVA